MKNEIIKGSIVKYQGGNYRVKSLFTTFMNSGISPASSHYTIGNRVLINSPEGFHFIDVDMKVVAYFVGRDGNLICIRIISGEFVDLKSSLADFGIYI